MKYISLITFTFILCGCFHEKTVKIKTGLEGKPLPAIPLLQKDSSTIFNTSSIAPGKPTLVFIFETWCPYCKAQTQSLISNINSIKDINLCMVCYTDFRQFKNFYKHYKLDKYPNIESGVDYTMSFARYFQTTAIPLLAVYDKQKNLKQVFMGKTGIKAIKKNALD